MKKRIICILLTVALISSMGMTAFAAEIQAQYDFNGQVNVSSVPENATKAITAIYDAITGQLKTAFSSAASTVLQARTLLENERMKLFFIDDNNAPVCSFLEVSAVEPVSVRYDDHIPLSAAPAETPTIVTKSVTSKNALTGQPDSAVMTYDAASNSLIATGVGVAEVTVDGSTTVYNVEAAPISLLLITGHSVGEGAAGDAAMSIANEPGQVYSTYAPAQTDTLTSSDGVALGYCSAARPNGIDALVANGGGTRGEGSALAYRWTALRNEKIWVVNTAHGGTNLNTWLPDTDDYEHTVEQVGYVQAILAREIAAGHYTFSHMGIINHSSANSDEIWPTDTYVAAFEAMCEGFRTELAYDLTGDSEKEPIEFFALSPLWHMSNMNEQVINPFPLSKRLRFNNGRLTNYTDAVSTDHPDVFMACSLGRSFMTDEGVAAYFAKSGAAYDTTYPTQNGVPLTEPTVMANALFPDGVHYNQIGYNAAGMNIAENIDAYLNQEAARSVTLYTEDGIKPIGDTVEMAVGDSFCVVALPDPICIHDLTFEASGAITLTDRNKLTAVSAGAGTFTVKQGQTVLRTVTVTVTALPAYTETVSTSTDYASYGGDNWSVTPKLLEATIGTREKYTLAIAASYWANPSYTGYNEKPTMLGVNFTSGDGLLKFYVRVDEGPIWGGAECELLTVMPTLEAYRLTKTTTVTGTVDIYWRGFCAIPFSITIKPTSGEDLPAYTVTNDSRTDYANYGGDSWDVTPKLLEASIGAREKYTMALASAYWANTSYTYYNETPRELTAKFTSGEGLLNFAVSVDKFAIWNGEYDCELLTITPTSEAYYLTEETTVTGTISIYWRGPCEMPFSITIKPVEKTLYPTNYVEIVSGRTDYANAATGWETTPPTLTATFHAREMYTMALCSEYWANPSVSGYGEDPTPLKATFTNGDGLLDFSVKIACGPVWSGASCEYLTITPSNAAYAITETITVTGTVSIYWTGYTQIPFSITLKPIPNEEKTEVVSSSTTACNDDWQWTGDGDSVAALPTGSITTDQIYVAALVSNYWCDNTYTTTATPSSVSFTSGDGLVSINLRLRSEAVIWGGAECVFAEITPTAAGELITQPTVVSGTFQMFYAAWGTYANIPFSITLNPA